MQNNNRRSRKKNNKRKELTGKKIFGKRFVLQIILVGIFITAMALLLFSSIQKGKKANLGQNVKVETEPVTSTEKSLETLKSERVVAVDGIFITGLSKEDARKKLLNAYQWDIKISYQDSVEKIKNPLPESLDALLKDIYSQDESLWQENYEFDVASMESSIREQVEAVTSKWNTNAVSAQLTGRDKENGSWIYTGGKNGIKINLDAAVAGIMAELEKKNFTATIAVSAEETAPKYTVGEVKEKYQVIGSFSTVATSNSNRNNNINLAMNALDGLVIFPGEEFSFNKTTGNRTTERGYLPAGAYRNGEFVEEPGGGVCQVSSTLYNAIIFSGIKTTERNPHSFEPSYVTPGEDAMVSYDGYSGPDLRFVNKQDTSVAIRAVFKDKKLTISIIGVPILEEGVKVTMRSEKIKEYDPPAPKYEEDQTLQPGQEVVVQDGVKGTTWKTWLVTTENKKVTKEDYFHSSTYKGKAGISKRNTTGVVIPAPTVPETAPTAPAVGEAVPDETKPPETLPAQTQPAETKPAETLVPEGPAGPAGPAGENNVPEIPGGQTGPGFQ